jgi:hypothetical protein
MKLELVRSKTVVRTIPHWAVRLAARYPLSGPQSEPTRLVFATQGGIGYHNNSGQKIPVGEAREI